MLPAVASVTGSMTAGITLMKLSVTVSHNCLISSSTRPTSEGSHTNAYINMAHKASCCAKPALSNEPKDHKECINSKTPKPSTSEGSYFNVAWVVLFLISLSFFFFFPFNHTIIGDSRKIVRYIDFY